MSPSIFTSIINSYLPEPHASLLNGIIFGINLKTSPAFYDNVKIVGLLHIVVLSGINITILAAIITKITSNFSKRISILITILTIILFILFVGPQAPVVRAGIMGILTLVAILFGRKNTVIYSLLLSFIFIACFFPKWLTGISLYLSYGATLGIVLFSSNVHKASKNIIDSVFYSITSDFKTSLAAQVFTTPIIFIAFKQLSIISPISNILVSFAITPLMIFGFLTAILGKIHYVLGIIPAYICYGLLSYIIWVINTLADLPYIFFKF
ncbi:MAG: ComEC/Rec2 family competence protein [bacterium]|nr:ComEC/Rec2 family competence protein [bacterium]